MAGRDDQSTRPKGEDFEDMSEVTMKLSLPRERRLRRVAIPTVRVVAGPDMLRFASLGAEERIVVGRDEAAGLVLTDASVSRNHALLQCDDQGEVTVQDLGSTNGTAVNGQQVSRALLRPGDHLEVGAVSLRLDLLGLDELAHLRRVLERLEAAGHDPLTGLHTRTYLADELPELVQRCDDANAPCSMIFGDVDHFKNINDTWGHAVGDEVLRGISRLLLLGIRDTDAAVRYGGEELAIFLPGSSASATTEVAERLRRSVAGHDWARTAGGLKVTISFGVAERLPGESIADWMERADQAMYQAKRGGRNRVATAGKP
ncbi:MAG: GGDEF domain-containing protein [Myxococcota bacterium]|nr:GGDEF domain-containing protein [Myxococcota bacterium]